MKHFNYKGNILYLIKKYLGIILYISIVLEIVFFPTWANTMGCAMAVIVWIIFKTFFLKRKIIINHPFSFLMFTSIFLYRYLPLVATLMELKPITYGFETPYQTFFYETLLFLISSMSFSAAIHINNRSNNILSKTLNRLHFFETTPTILWILGLIGIIVRLQQFLSNDIVEYGDVNNKFLAGLVYLQYAPLIMLFPTLCGININKQRNKFIWTYTVFIFIISFATNSREAMIYPIFTLLILFFLQLILTRKNLFSYFTPVKLFILSLVIIFGSIFISDISLAMLLNRNIRNDVSKTELLTKTIETLQDRETMQILRSINLEENKQIISYKNGWDESYLNNFMLNRYGNLRISDQTIYYANKIGWGNEKMLDAFLLKIVAIVPLPILNFFGHTIDKKSLEYSPGDLLYSIAGGVDSILGGYRVTSHIGDGLATFSIWYFLIQFILFFFVFKLLDCLVFYNGNQIKYSTLGLINIFGFLGMFRNAGGCGAEIGYILRGFWQLCFTYWIVLFLIRIITLKKD